MADSIKIDVNNKLIDEIKRESIRAKEMGSIFGASSILAAALGAIPFIGGVTGGVLGGILAGIAAAYLKKKLESDKLEFEIRKLTGELATNQAEYEQFKSHLENLDMDTDISEKLHDLRLFIEKIQKQAGDPDRS